MIFLLTILFLFFFNTFAKDVYYLAVLSSDNPVLEYKRYKTLSNYLSKNLDKPVKLKIVQKANRFLALYKKGNVDIGIACPVVFYMLKEENKAKEVALLKIDGAITEKGVWITKKESSINSLKDLKDKRLTLGSSICASNAIMPLMMLLNAGIRFEDIMDLWSSGTDKGAILNVIAGLADAGGVSQEYALRYLHKGLKIIAVSPPVPRYVVFVSKSLTKKEVESIQKALFSLNNKNILQKLNIDGFVRPESKLFENIKDYKNILDKYPVLK